MKGCDKHIQKIWKLEDEELKFKNSLIFISMGK